MSANDRQVGGSHYGGGAQQHWDIVHQHGLDYFQGQITKYVMRWRKKNGLQDLEKAQHFLEKYIELVKSAPKVEPARTPVADNAAFQAQRAGEAITRPHPLMNSLTLDRDHGLQVEGWYGDGRIQYKHIATKRTVIANSPEHALHLLATTPPGGSPNGV